QEAERSRPARPPRPRHEASSRLQGRPDRRQGPAAQALALQARVALPVENERPLGRAGLRAHDLAYEEGVVPGLVLAGDAAAEPPDGALELRRPVRVPERDALPESDRGNAAREPGLIVPSPSLSADGPRPENPGFRRDISRWFEGQSRLPYLRG